MKNQVQRVCEPSVLFLVIAFAFSLPLGYFCQEGSQGRGVEPGPVQPQTRTNIPPRPNSTVTRTAKPDPFDTEDPTTQAKVILRRDLFSEENGKILFYALLVARKACNEPPQSGNWNIGENWPNIHNWEFENVSYYQVTQPRWDPFELNSTTAVFILGDGTHYGPRYWNKPLVKRTLYKMKIRAFTQTGFQDTNVLHFRTLDNLPVFKIVSILGGLFAVTAAAVYLSIFDFEWLTRIKMLSGGKSKESSPVPVALSHKSFLKYTKSLLNTPGRLGNEFHLLGTLSADVSTLCLHAQRVDNRKKNRYGNILPFDMTRVKLSIIDDDPSTDYINASFIKGYTQEIEYIACQGPKEETCHDFYRMIIEQNVELIVMLTALNEMGTEKCYKYYPNCGEDLDIKEMRINCDEVQDLEFCIKRMIVIKTADKNVVVTQLHFTKWPDFSCPDSIDVMLKFCDYIHRTPRKGCIAVHCSAGAGRTGTFIAIDILLQDVKSNNKISVFDIVLKLRQQRVSMVQTEAQLGYIYKCVSSAIEGSM